jgi:hypothetical protein
MKNEVNENKASVADVVAGFDSSSLAQLSASLADTSQFIRSNQTSSMSVLSASFASE